MGDEVDDSIPSSGSEVFFRRRRALVLLGVEQLQERVAHDGIRV